MLFFLFNSKESIMVKAKNFIKYFGIAAICAGLTACGGGGEDSPDPVSQPTTPGQGSSTPSAEVTGTIQYTQYQATNTAMGEAAFATTTLSANAVFNSTTKEGTITFPVLGGTEVVSTKDGYATTTWTGPFTSGAYKLNGNILMGCNAAAQTENQATHVFVSSSLTRLRDGAIDDLNGKTFDLIDCGIIKQAAAQTLTVNADGSLFMSTANYTFPKNEVFNLLNPEKYSGALINNNDPRARGNYAGHAFRFNSNGVSKYAIVIQTNANAFNDANRYHYMIAVQR
jgi:hypothetical protein